MQDGLVEAACRGDVEARNELGRWLQVELHRFFSKRFMNRDKISELVQATTLDVWAKLEHAPREPKGFTNWVRSFGGTAAKAARTQVKREAGRQAKLERVLPHAFARTLSSQVAEHEALQLVEQCLAQLATPYREIARHRLAEGRFDEFAKAHGIKVKTARWRHAKAVRQLEVLVKQQQRITPPSRSS